METIMSIKSKLVSGQDCRSFVKELKLFHNSGFNSGHPKGATLWSELRDDIYVVYSYGQHWPLYINWKGIWFSNNDKSPSRTTSKHTSQTNPYVPTVPVSNYGLMDIVHKGYPAPELLVKAAKLKLIPEHLIPEATYIRIGAAA
jgi:hypothetical protein